MHVNGPWFQSDWYWIPRVGRPHRKAIAFRFLNIYMSIWQF